MYRRTRQRPVASCPCVPPVAACLLKTCFRRFAEPEAKGAADRYSITHATDDCYCKSTMTVDLPADYLLQPIPPSRHSQPAFGWMQPKIVGSRSGPGGRSGGLLLPGAPRTALIAYAATASAF